MLDKQKYINALRKCAKEHENDRTSTGHIIVSDLCRDTADLIRADKAEIEILKKRVKELEALDQEPKTGYWHIKDNMWWVCSACECKTRMMKKYNVPNFCPACGARMVAPKESEDKDGRDKDSSCIRP